MWWKIYAGQTIKIPQKKTAQQSEIFHTIQAGETLYKLTIVYNISAKAICEANPGLSAENFRIGQVIRIPSAEEAAQATADSQEPNNADTEKTTNTIQGPVQSRCKEMHKVKRRETIFSVSREYGISEQELINANPELKQGMKRDNSYVFLIHRKSRWHRQETETPFPLPIENYSLPIKKLRKK